MKPAHVIIVCLTIALATQAWLCHKTRSELKSSRKMETLSAGYVEHW